MFNLKIQISKRNNFLFLFFSLFILSFLCSCKNFYSGSEFINNLEKSGLVIRESDISDNRKKKKCCKKR